MTFDLKSKNDASENSLSIESSDFSLWYSTGLAKNSLLSIVSRFLFILDSAILFNNPNCESVKSLASMNFCSIAPFTISSPLSVLIMSVDQPSSDPMEPIEMSEVSDVSSTQILQFFLIILLATERGIFTVSLVFKSKNTNPFSIWNFSMSSIFKSYSFKRFTKYLYEKFSIQNKPNLTSIGLSV